MAFSPLPAPAPLLACTPACRRWGGIRIALLTKEQLWTADDEREFPPCPGLGLQIWHKGGGDNLQIDASGQDVMFVNQ